MLNALIPQLIQDLIKNRQSVLLKGLLAIGVFIVVYIIIKIIVQKVRKRMEANSLQEDVYSKRVSHLAGSIIFVVLMIFNVLAVFQVIGFDTAILMGGISLSFGFAMETTIENMVSGVMLLTNKKIRIGDYLEFMGSLNITGTVEEVNIRYTVIRTFDKRRTIIPNSIISETPIKTLKTEPLIRGELEFKVPRHTDIDQVKSLLLQTINAHKGILYPEYTNTIITTFDTIGIGLKSFFFSDPAKKSPFIIARELKPEILEVFKKYGIKIPYAHMTLTAE